MCTAPDAAECAPFLGQPFFGATSRISERPKFAIARAAMPIFSASWGSTRMMTGWYVTVLLNLRAALDTRLFVLPKAPRRARASYEPHLDILGVYVLPLCCFVADYAAGYIGTGLYPLTLWTFGA